MNRPIRGYPRLDIPRPGETLPDRFARIVEAHRSRPALASENLNLTYGELDSIADHLAHALAARGGQPGDRVALLMRHDTPQIAAMLAVLKAGRIVVVLNPTDAAARLRLVVEDAEPALVLADKENAILANEIAQGFCATASYDELALERASQPKLAIDPEATAFIVYTSGSSGRPKGVMMNHHQVMHNALRLSDAMDIGADSRVALLPSLSGLHGVNAAWCALLHGALLRPFPVMERGVTGLADWMIEHRISTFSASTSLFRSFMKSLKEGSRIDPVRMVRVGGELVTSDDFKAFQEHFSDDCILLNTLASSEAGNITSLRYAKDAKVPEGTLAVGRVFESIEIAITDEQGGVVKSGDAGQIVVTSPYMSQGYWRNDALTAERYLRDAQGRPVFKSGDWGRINEGGILEFTGRKDTLVKIHGSSVELDEVEKALCKAPGVEKAVVCAWEGPNSTQLVAYLVLQPGRTATSPTLRRAARALLPELMVPSIFILVDDFPLTPHGKTDRRKLLEAHPPKVKQSLASSFTTEMEVLLGTIWSEAFDLPSIGRDDNFFELGGDSLIASVIAARLYSETGAELNLGMFADNPTVASMAAIVDRLQQTKPEDSHLRRVSREQPLPLSFAQERIWSLSQTEQGLANYTLVGRYRLLGALNPAILRECMNRLSRRHELLRTTFTTVGGQPIQVVHPPSEVALDVVDLTKEADADGAGHTLIARIRARPLDMGTGPLVRFTLIRISENEHWLVRICHHILYDDSSWRLYFEELAELYESAIRGANLPLPDFEPLQYADYAWWQREFFRTDSQSRRSDVSWWKRALSDLPPSLEFPFKRKASVGGVDPSEGFIKSKVNADVSHRLAEFSIQHGATTFHVGLAIFVALLAVRIGQRDIVIGTYVSNRKRLELLEMFGDFSNLVTLRFRVDLDKTFRAWVSAVRDAVVETVAHSELPYEELRRSFEREEINWPEIQTIFQARKATPPIRFAGLEIKLVGANTLQMPWGFNPLMDQNNFNCMFMFNASVYDPEAVRTMAEQWTRFSETVSRHPDLPLKELLAMSGIDARIPTTAERLLARLFRRR